MLSGWSGDRETRKKTGEDGEVGKIGVALFLAKSSSKRGVTLQFLCTVVDLVAFIGSGRTGTREHPETVLHHDAMEKYQARVGVAGHAACREVSQTARGLRRERGEAGREQ